MELIPTITILLLINVINSDHVNFKIWEEPLQNNFRSTMIEVEKFNADTRNFTIENDYFTFIVRPDVDCNQYNSRWYKCRISLKQSSWRVSGAYADITQSNRKGKMYKSPWRVNTYNPDNPDEIITHEFDISKYQLTGENVPDLNKMYVNMFNIGTEGNFRVFGCVVTDGYKIWKPTVAPKGSPYEVYMPLFEAGVSGEESYPHLDDVYGRYEGSRFSFWPDGCVRRTNSRVMESVILPHINTTKIGMDARDWCHIESCFHQYTRFWMIPDSTPGQGQINIRNPIILKAAQARDLPHVDEEYIHPTMLRLMQKVFIEGVRDFGYVKTYNISVNGSMPPTVPELEEGDEILAYFYSKPSCAVGGMTAIHNSFLKRDTNCNQARRVYRYRGPYSPGKRFMNAHAGVDCGHEPAAVIFYGLRNDTELKRIFVEGYYEELATDTVHSNVHDNECYHEETKQSDFSTYINLVRDAEEINGWVAGVKAIWKTYSFDYNHKQRVNRCPLGNYSFTVAVYKSVPATYKCNFSGVESENSFRITEQGGVWANGSPRALLPPTDPPPTTSGDTPSTSTNHNQSSTTSTPPTTTEDTRPWCKEPDNNTGAKIDFSIGNHTLKVMDDHIRQFTDETKEFMRLIIYIGVPTGLCLFIATVTFLMVFRSTVFRHV
uniref:ORF43 n=1 Tax=Malaco herpesvirus 1 TaxID=3031797 RepID=A0AA48P7S2_9VIRU|nr:TPA_asm: ORF43 [Malaco herpesvirus 1]